MPGDTFSTYHGEFLISPIPLELSGNYCSHACPYCFANLNSEIRHKKKKTPLRYADTKATMKMLANYQERDTLEAYWLREGYPVLVSNRVDLFAKSNFQTFIPLLDVMTQMDIPLTFQTRGGYGIDEALEFLKPAVWYLSFDYQDDELRQRYAPANPTIESRYELIAKLVDKGHAVTVGINPLTEEWIPHPEKILKRLKELGVWGVWFEVLHFNADQAKAVLEHGIIPPAMVERYRKKKLDDRAFDFFLECRQVARDIGLEVHSGLQGTPSNYFEIFHQYYPKLLPTLQDWVNVCHEEFPGGDRNISFEEFKAFMLASGMPDARQRWGHYIGATAHQVCREHPAWSNWMTTEDFLKAAWTDKRLKWAPVLLPCFAWVSEPDGTLRLDENGVPVQGFWPEYSEFLKEQV